MRGTLKTPHARLPTSCRFRNLPSPRRPSLAIVAAGTGFNRPGPQNGPAPDLDAQPATRRCRDRRSSPDPHPSPPRTTKGKRFGFEMRLHLQAVSTLQDYVATLSDRRPSAFLFRGRWPGKRLSKTEGWRAIDREYCCRPAFPPLSRTAPTIFA